ncbi:MAG: ABC transporter ATP-binding protein [Firmicutes bacterium]|nr:ABC transporter ATP-binding protein [Bacillota bacterium]
MLTIDKLEVSYGAIRALHGISLEVPDGSIVCLIGANGAGKSTTLKTISGLLRPRAGSIRYQGDEITHWAPKRIVAAGISHVPEGRRIFADQTVEENLRLGAYSRRDRAEVAKDLEFVYELFPRLRERRKQLGGTLSGGEQQMLAIGRGLMARPKLLLLDEPSMGLSPLLVREIFSIIQTINRQGTTILLVEQNAYMALGVASFAYVLETGRVALQGPAKELASSSEVRRAYLGG